MNILMTSVTKRYRDGTLGLDDFDLLLDTPGVVGITGPNGAGKTTMLELLAGALQPTSGTICAFQDGVSLNEQERRLRTGFAAQDVGLFLPLTVRQNIGFFGELNGVAPRAMPDRVEDLVTRFALGEIIDSPCARLSGGQRRRAHIAAALVHEPQLVILDEPTTALDVDSQYLLLAAVSQLAKDGATVCYSTHRREELDALDARHVLLGKGRLEHDARASAHVNRTAGAEASAFFDIEFDRSWSQLMTEEQLADTGDEVDDRTIRVGVPATCNWVEVLRAALDEAALDAALNIRRRP